MIIPTATKIKPKQKTSALRFGQGRMLFSHSRLEKSTSSVGSPTMMNDDDDDDNDGDDGGNGDDHWHDS